MIRGIYNENEFYSNQYWDSKLPEDLRAKLASTPSTAQAVVQLRALESDFWSMRDLADGDPRLRETLLSFTAKVLTALGYQPKLVAHVTADERAISTLCKVESKDGAELVCFATGERETGEFDSGALFVAADTDGLKLDEREFSQILREELLESESAPRWAILAAPNAIFVINRSKWPFGRYIRLDWEEVFFQRDTKVYELIYALAGKPFLCPDTGASLHDELDDNSHRHAFEVTTELREGVRESIELLVNEIIHSKREAHEKYLRKDADKYAKELTHDALFYVYRLIFLLFLESQGDDSELLPLKSDLYQNGYSLEKLLEMEFTPLIEGTPDYEGTFFQISLERIFTLIFYGFAPERAIDLYTKEQSSTGFLIKGIKSDLFDPTKIPHFSGARLRNGIVQQILQKLSLTKVAAGRGRGKAQRGRVSYANLGINQLGAVYEGLLSYTGFFASEDLHALKSASVKQSDLDANHELDQMYLAPKSLVDVHKKSGAKYKLTGENIVLDDAGNAKIYKKGSFVYRMAGRDRQRLASFYTPESLTKCTVKYALKVLFETKKTLDDLWSIKILEPAMGSGAFLNEAVNQIAERILALEAQQASNSLSSPKAKKERFWRIKYTLISNNVYGVDLNPTAIELARFSLWLNCIGAGQEPPSFKGRLKIGNSLIGARFKKTADGFYPWLLLDDGMLSPGKRFRDFDSEGAKLVEETRNRLFASRLRGTDNQLRSVQVLAEERFRQLLGSASPEEAGECFQRLKMACDLWCSVFFWPADGIALVPQTHAAFLTQIERVLKGDPLPEQCHRTVIQIVSEERFFHWDLEFPAIVSSGGFDLILGNPPWVSIAWDDAGYLSDINPIASVLELSASITREFIAALSDESVTDCLAKELTKVSGYIQMLEASPYQVLKGIKKNTYKYFDVIALDVLNKSGVLGFIQEDGLLEDEGASVFREELYLRFRYHFQFQNELLLFQEVLHKKRYSVNILSGQKQLLPSFYHIGDLFLPMTIEACLSDELPTFEVPGIKNSQSKWEILGHPKRTVHVNSAVLALFAEFSGANPKSPPLLNLHSESFVSILERLTKNSVRLIDYVVSADLVGSTMFHETGAQDAGLIVKRPGRASSMDRTVYSGPNIDSFNPFAKESRAEYKNNASYDIIDLEKMAADFIPRTVYQLNVEPTKVDAAFAQTQLNGQPFRKYFRLVTRTMVNPTNERLTFTAILPPGPSHINGMVSVAISNKLRLAVCAGVSASLVADLTLRLRGTTNFFSDDYSSLPIGSDVRFYNSIARRALALNCLTSSYALLWEGVGELNCDSDSLGNGRVLEGFGKSWKRDYPIFSPTERLVAVTEVEALVALSFKMTMVELSQTYDVMFPVLVKYDRDAGINRKGMMAEAFLRFQKRGW